MHRIFLLIPLVLLSCKREKPSDSDTDVDTDTDSDTFGGECEDDDGCGWDQICEEAACLDGDRDDAFEDARSILLNQAESGRILVGDVDHFAYESPGDEWLRVSTVTQEVDGGLDTVVSVFAANGALHASMDAFATGNVSTFDTLFHVYLPDSGVWYFRVEDKSTYEGTDPVGGLTEEFHYELELQEFEGVTSEDDSFGSPRLAVTMANGGTVYAVGVNLEEEGDADWIQAALPWTDAPIEVWGLPDLGGSDARSAAMRRSAASK